MDERERNEYEYEKRRGYGEPVGRDQRNRRIWGGILTALLVIGGIWGWNASQDKRTAGLEQPGFERQVRGTSAVRGYEARQTTREVGVGERAGERVATTSGQARLIKVDKGAIERLKQGESVDFYLSEFKRQGFTVTPIHKMKDHATFVVHNQIQDGAKRREAASGILVTLHKDDKNQPDKVTSIETEDYKP